MSGIIINPYSFATGSAFSNTKSLDFDGTDDYVDCGSYSLLNSGTSVTASVWFKSSVYTDYGRLLMAGKHVEIYQSAAAYTVTQGRFYYRLRGASGIPFATLGGASATGVGDLCDGDWHHLCIVWDNSTTTAIIYEDGVPVITDTSVTGTLNSATWPLYIGAETSTTYPIQGNVDEVAIWDTALSPTDVATVYGGGTPDDLTSLSPITWYRMGENSTFKTPQILMPENTNKDKVSNFSMDFDGVDDNIDCGDLSAYDNGDFTFSCWIYKTTSALEYVWSNGGSSATAGFGMAINNVEKIWMKRNTRTIDCATGYQNMGFTLNNWHNIVGIYTDSTNTMECYVDGVLKYTKVGAASTNSASLDLIMGSTSPAGSYDFTGKMDEFSIFNSVKAIGDIWDGSGKPTDLTGQSGLVSWWRMGEEAIFDPAASEWTVPDQVGSNDGTSANMTIEDREGDAPDSENNALSYNMDAADIDSDTP